MQKPTIALGLAVLLSSATPAVSQQSDAPPQGVTFYGQINRDVLSYDDGPTDNTYWFVDNSKSVSRIGATYDTPLNDGWRLHARGELALK